MNRKDIIKHASEWQKVHRAFKQQPDIDLAALCAAHPCVAKQFPTTTNETNQPNK